MDPCSSPRAVRCKEAEKSATRLQFIICWGASVLRDLSSFGLESRMEIRQLRIECQLIFEPGGVRTGIAKHHGRYSLTICVKMARSEHLAGSDCGDEYSLNTP